MFGTFTLKLASMPGAPKRKPLFGGAFCCSQGAREVNWYCKLYCGCFFKPIVQEDMMEYDLQRFLKAQEADYRTALTEIRNGRKRSHWMWYIFPQIAGLGFSSTSKYYSLKDLREAKAYLDDEIFGKRLLEISGALLNLENNGATKIFGTPDDMKLCSSMTLFSRVKDADPVFQKVLDKFFDGLPDEKTIHLLSDKY
jgi:uncharacterized protein (DUF1810 family)